MNKFTTTYLDAVDDLLAIHLKHPDPEDWHMIISDLADAVRELNGERCVPYHRVFHHDWTPEELAQREKPIKPLTLDDLKRQLDRALSGGSSVKPVCLPEDDPSGALFLVGEFEIRRRK